jgi:hypothetical protein
MVLTNTQKMILTGIGVGVLIGLIVGSLGAFFGLSAGVRGGLTGAITVVALVYLGRRMRTSRNPEIRDQN